MNEDAVFAEGKNAVRSWEWLWFAPAAAVALLVSESHTIPYAVAVAKLAAHRWDWGGFISPSAYFCWTVTLLSVMWPIYGMAIAQRFLFGVGFAESVVRKRIVALALVIVVLLLPFISDALIWGSFPFTFDNSGAGHLRLIPFLPWPDAPFGTF